MIRVCILLVAFFAINDFSAAQASDKDAGHLSSHWSYSGATGPQYWDRLNPKYGVCAQGVNQSPINLQSFIDAKLPPIEFAYSGQASEILYNGHTVQVNFPAHSASIRIDGNTFELKQFHLHAPAENQIENTVYAMEAHFVHADQSGHLAVVAIMMQGGKTNPALEGLWREFPTQADGPHPLKVPFFAESMLPVNREYYRYNGSLTTPPCTEGVRWLVLKQAIPVSDQQIKRFTTLMRHPNNRPVQPVNARMVLR
ncbi:MAG: carbonic anhydrase family protein [Magnetococcales bacterium]|nr:carbonic anhydrase family protein [Magnetococcales bacterium]